MKIAMACDHGGFHLKEHIKKYLTEKGIEIVDHGTYNEDSVDYPDFAEKLCKDITSGESGAEPKERPSCFSSPLARIVQEQGRAQLGRSFGSARHPECRGFTMEELGMLDWDSMDLSEWVEIERETGHYPDEESAASALRSSTMECPTASLKAAFCRHRISSGSR